MEEGNKVKLVQPTINGVIVDTRYSKQARQLEHLVEYTDTDGEIQSRWFLENELEIADE